MRNENETMEKVELDQEEVNVYASCGAIKIHCLYDCYMTNNAWISTSN